MSAYLPAFALLLAGVGVMRLAELRVSRRRWLGAPDGPVPEPRLFPLMALLHAGLVVAPILEVMALERPFLPPLALAAGIVLAAATVLRVWTLRTIGKAWNVRIVRPEPDAVVTSGPYAFIRHPNYLAVVLEVAALPLLHTAWISCLTLSGLNAIVLLYRIRAEEAVLEQLPSWRDAMAERPRLIPWRLPRRP